MIEKGYLVHNKGGCFDFYETPRLPQERPQTAADLSLMFWYGREFFRRASAAVLTADKRARNAG